MSIAVMSDLHDNVAAWKSIAQYLAAEHIETLINCGDTCAPAMLQKMSEDFSGTIHTVFGNVADRELEKSVAKELSNVKHYGDAGDCMIEDKKIFFNHFPNVAEQAAASGDYQLVCHGHTHLKRWEPAGLATILNPGTAGGMFQYPSFATVDLQTMTCKFIDLTT